MINNCDNTNKPKNFKELISSLYFRKSAIAFTIGGVLGFLFYHFEGCPSGSCGITSNPISSIIFGALLGLFVVNRPCKTC